MHEQFLYFQLFLQQLLLILYPNDILENLNLKLNINYNFNYYAYTCSCACLLRFLKMEPKNVPITIIVGKTMATAAVISGDVL